MEHPTLDLSLPPRHRWSALLEADARLKSDWRIMLRAFEKEADTIISTTLRTPAGRCAKWLHRAWNRRTAELLQELEGVSDYLNVDIDLALAGQLVYDASTAHGISATCGCTSSAQLWRGKSWHGRLMDWDWPRAIKGRVRLITVKGAACGTYQAEHIPGVTGFVGAFRPGCAANLNQAPHSRVRWSQTPALWWFRQSFEEGLFDTSAFAPLGSMTDALVHVTSGRSTSRLYYRDGYPWVRRSRLTDRPVVLANSFDMQGVPEDSEAYAWSMEREHNIVSSRLVRPAGRLSTARCDATVHQWSASW